PLMRYRKHIAELTKPGDQWDERPARLIIGIVHGRKKIPPRWRRSKSEGTIASLISTDGARSLALSCDSFAPRCSEKRRALGVSSRFWRQPSSRTPSG